MDQNQYDHYEETEQPKKKKSGIFRGIFCLLLIVIAAWIGFHAGRYTLLGAGRNKAAESSTGEAENMNMNIVDQKLQLLKLYVDQYYLDPIKPEKMEEGIYRGFIAGLEDPYAEYYSPDEYKRLMEEDSGSYEGIGVTVMKDTDTGYVMVEASFEGQPAYNAGIRQGDLIVSVNDKNTVSMDLSEVVNEIRRPDRKNAVLKISRDNKILDFNIKKASITLDTVSFEMKKDNIGYIKVTEFIENTDEDFNKAIDQLLKQKMKGLIIDLRNNGGGLVDSSVNMVSRIIPKDKLVVYTKDKYGEEKDYNSNSAEVLTLPIIILVNEATASASEIMTGCLKDYDAAEIVGTKTYGKGVVQNIMPISDGSAIKFTVFKYYTPKGNDIHKKGIEPDKKVEMTPEEMEAARKDESKDKQLQEAPTMLK